MEAKPCGLIIEVPPALQNEWTQNVSVLARRFRPAALILRSPNEDTLLQLIAAARPLELAILVADDVVTACNAGANGTYFSTENAAVAKAREVLGSAAVIGALCVSRHAAMENAEAGADFIAFDASDSALFGKATDLCAWWDEVASVPVALALGVSRPESTVLSKARPDFLLVEESRQAGESLTFATEIGLQSQT
jgi:thiamine-phosphate pyrophosphorylase